jgi:hypothetical protein
MTHGTDAPQRMFDDRRQATGWLAWTWSVYLAVAVGLALGIFVMWTGGPPPSPIAGIGFGAIVALLVVWIWGWRARSGVSADRARALAEDRNVSRWGLSTFTVVRAAEKVGWPPAVAAWVNRVLITLVNVLGFVAAILLVAVLVG